MEEIMITYSQKIEIRIISWMVLLGIWGIDPLHSPPSIHHQHTTVRACQRWKQKNIAHGSCLIPTVQPTAYNHPPPLPRVY